MAVVVPPMTRVGALAPTGLSPVVAVGEQGAQRNELLGVQGIFERASHTLRPQLPGPRAGRRIEQFIHHAHRCQDGKREQVVAGARAQLGVAARHVEVATLSVEFETHAEALRVVGDQARDMRPERLDVVHARMTRDHRRRNRRLVVGMTQSRKHGVHRVEDECDFMGAGGGRVGHAFRLG
jgi:hypothetical protein